MSGVSPQIEKDIARKLALKCRNKVLAAVKAILADFDSRDPEALEHWNKIMDVFVDANLADDFEFNACKERLRTRPGSQPGDRLTAVPVVTLENERQASHRETDVYSSAIKEVRAVLHAGSLRAIGRSLEMLRLPTFRLEKRGDVYIVRSDSLTATHQWIVRNYLAENVSDSSGPEPNSTELTVGEGWLCYGPGDIARLRARERKKRDNRGFEQTREADKLSQLLHTLGAHLDSKEAAAFEISWAPESVSVEYHTPSGVLERKDFTVEKLHQLALRSRFRRPNRRVSIGSR